MHIVRKTTQLASIAAALTAAVVFLAPQSASAFPSWAGDVTNRYPSATNLGNCGTCHNSFTSGAGLNPYGSAINGASGSADERMAAVEGDDSDGDGETNLAEIMTASGFEPGWNCETYANASNAPGDLADYVDVNDVGCVGVTTTMQPSTTTGTTTTTIITTTTMNGTTTSSTTTTTLAAANCSQPVSGGPNPTSTDCLFILNAAVGVTTCTPECICAPSGTLPISATDALVCLNKAVGVDVPLNCPCGS